VYDTASAITGGDRGGHNTEGERDGQRPQPVERNAFTTADHTGDIVEDDRAEHRQRPVHQDDVARRRAKDTYAGHSRKENRNAAVTAKCQ
jgi:hypothetical protein